MPRTRQPGGLADELDPYVDRAEVRRFNRIGELLRAQRATPRPGLIERMAAGPAGETPPSFRLQVAVSLFVGGLILGLALLGASGSGPLGG